MYNDDVEIKDLCLLGHTVNALNRTGIYTVGQLKEMSDMELLDTKGIGMKSLDEITRLVPDRIRAHENEQPKKQGNEKLTPEDVAGMGGADDNMSLDKLCLSTRTYKALARCKINTVGKVKQYTDKELLSLRTIGAKAIDEINKFIPDRIRECDNEERLKPLTAEGILNMLESGMTMFDIQLHYNRGIISIERLLCEHCNNSPESVERLITIYEKQFEMNDRFYGLLKEERRSEHYCKAMGLPYLN